MDLRFVGVDPDTGGNNCPAVFVDDETADFLFQGEQVTDPDALVEIGKHSPVGQREVVVRVPARMAKIIMEALDGRDL